MGIDHLVWEELKKKRKPLREQPRVYVDIPMEQIPVKEKEKPGYVEIDILGDDKTDILNTSSYNSFS